MAPAAQAAPTCRAGTVPACFPAAHASGWACAVKPDADPSALGKAIEWVCGAGGTDCAQISGAPSSPGACWDPAKAAGAQNHTLFGNLVFQLYYAQHCNGSAPAAPGQPCPGPGSPGAGACDFGGVAHLVPAPVPLPCRPAGTMHPRLGFPENCSLTTVNSCSQSYEALSEAGVLWPCPDGTNTSDAGWPTTCAAGATAGWPARECTASQLNGSDACCCPAAGCFTSPRFNTIIVRARALLTLPTAISSR